MLKIEVYNRGKEVYGITLGKADFQKEDFLKKHEDDYTALSDDSICNEIPIRYDGNDEVQAQLLVELNGDIVMINQEIGNEVTISNPEYEESYRELLSCKEDEVAVIWFHDFSNTATFKWDSVNEFELSKLSISIYKRNDDTDGTEYYLLAGIKYDGNEPDSEEIDGTPKTGYYGPDVIY